MAQIALTRNGSLSISPTGMLQTSDGHPVLGQGGGADHRCRRCRA